MRRAPFATANFFLQACSRNAVVRSFWWEYMPYTILRNLTL